MTRQSWPYKLTRLQAVSLVDRASDRDDPYWSNVVEDHYDEATDTMPSIYDLFAALGVSENEYKEATGAQNVDWPKGY